MDEDLIKLSLLFHSFNLSIINQLQIKSHIKGLVEKYKKITINFNFL